MTYLALAVIFRSAAAAVSPCPSSLGSSSHTRVRVLESLSIRRAHGGCLLLLGRGLNRSLEVDIYHGLHDHESLRTALAAGAPFIVHIEVHVHQDRLDLQREQKKPVVGLQWLRLE